CVSQIENIPPSHPRWPDSDQEMLKRVLRDYTDTEGYTLIRLEQDKYNALPDANGNPLPGALVDQWVLGCKMRFPQDYNKQWPPPEEARRPAPASAASKAD
ncbi:MAG TPA: hypothetical protein VEZ90_06905, partial [Blastocatellia bacterium]|nr:hypothetical protein [Blastocatellia bacterium]